MSDLDETIVPGSPGRELAVRLGDHLRRVRQQKGLSLHDVEAASAKEFKASILGAYERGERAITVARLSRLAALYGVPTASLLPPGEQPQAQAAPQPTLTLSVSRLRAHDAPEARVLLGYLRSMQAIRQDWTADVVTVRASDLYAIASVLERSPAEVVRRLDELGVRAAEGG